MFIKIHDIASYVRVLKESYDDDTLAFVPLIKTN